MLLARRDGAQVSFSLRAGVGTPVERPPWKVEWGGGASVENPHYQRVHYCDLLVRTHVRPLLSCCSFCCVSQQRFSWQAVCVGVDHADNDYCAL